ncbi:MAG TPA: chromate transporter [Thermodesulfovibrionales bacterium]|nr:chromate transporter [Thermodesulfovibrionales bacterium]
MTVADASVKNILKVFLKIGTFAFGGVYSMLAFFERELVQNRKWLSQEEFAESVVMGQLTPGAPIINTGIFIGYRLKRLKGALATVAGQVLPSFVIVLILSYLYIRYKEIALLKAVLKGVGAAVVALIASVVYSMSGKLLKEYKGILIAIVAFLCLAVFKLNPIGLIVAAGIVGLLMSRGEQ